MRRPPAGRILGIDPGTRMVGYGAVELCGGSEGFRYLECGVLRAAEGNDVAARVHELASNLSELIGELGPTEVAIEGAFAGRNVSSALKLAEARGALREVCFQAELEVTEYAPARVKRAVVGRGRATKRDVQARVGVLCGLERLPQSDAADALAVAICHAQARLFPVGAQTGAER